MLTPTTELEAVNTMLTSIDEVPVNSLDNLGFTDAAIARDLLRSAVREVLTRGWYFNTDESFPFTAAADSRVKIPDNVLSLVPAMDESRRISPRLGYLYDVDARTDVFTTGAEPRMAVVWGQDFDMLPESARGYIAVKAARVFQRRVQGSSTINAMTKDEEQAALTTLILEDQKYEKAANMFSDSADVSEVWQR